MLRKYQTYLLLLLVAGCASLLSNEPTKVDKIEARYIETEVQLKNLYLTMAELAKAEKRARAAGAPAGTVVTKEDYDTTLDRMDTFKTVLREGRLIVGGSCLDVAKFNDVDLKGCLSREQIALVLLNILSKFNQGRL